MKFIIAYIVWILNNFWIVSIVLVLGLSIYYFLVDYIRGRKPMLKFPVLLIPSLFITSLILLFLARYLTIPLIYYFGEETTGTVISIEGTASRYNEERVYKHNVLFKDHNDQPFETSFRTSDFNVYPITNSVRYPSSGQSFTLRYMKHMPHEFIIIRDEMAHDLSELYIERSELQNKLEFDPDNEQYLEELKEIEAQIDAIQKEQAEKRLEDFSSGNYNLSETVKDITSIENIFTNKDESVLFIETRTNSDNFFSENVILNYNLSTNSVKSLYPISVFDDFIGVFEQSLFIQSHHDDSIIVLNTKTLETNPFESIHGLMNIERTPLIVGQYMFEYNHKNSNNKIINLNDNKLQTRHYDFIYNIIKSTSWNLYPPHTHNEIIDKFSSLQTLSDYRNFFNDILNDPTQEHNHSYADSGIFFSENDETIDSITYRKAQDIILDSYNQSLLNDHLRSFAQYDIIGVENNGTVYGVALDNNKTYIIKKDPSGNMHQIETNELIDSSSYKTINLNSYIIIINQNNIYIIDKDSFTLKVSPLLQD